MRAGHDAGEVKGRSQEPTLLGAVAGLARAAYDALPEKAGAGMPAKMWEIGKAELLNAFYPESNIGIPPVVSAAQIETPETPLQGEYDRLMAQAQARPAPAREQGLER